MKSASWACNRVDSNKIRKHLDHWNFWCDLLCILSSFCLWFFVLELFREQRYHKNQKFQQKENHLDFSMKNVSVSTRIRTWRHTSFNMVINSRNAKFDWACQMMFQLKLCNFSTLAPSMNTNKHKYWIIERNWTRNCVATPFF